MYNYLTHSLSAPSRPGRVRPSVQSLGSGEVEEEEFVQARLKKGLIRGGKPRYRIRLGN